MRNTVPAGSLRPATTSTYAVELRRAGSVEVTVSDRDRTRPFLLLHGGAGPATMTGFADLLAERTHARVLTPAHPGFAGTPRPGSLASVTDLAHVYVAVLDRLDLSDVTVLGNSFGGWLAAEMALLDSPRVSGVVVVDAVGIEVPGHPLTDVSGLAPAELRALSFHDPRKAPPVAGPGPDVSALIAYGGPTMSDPTLMERLGTIDLPVHVIWGESDRIVDPDYGRAFAAAIPGAHFTLLPRTGHLPQVETPEELLGAVRDLGAR